MNENEPFYSYHPDSIGWLKRRHANGVPISKFDVARIVEADPSAANDPLVLDFIIRGLRGELRMKPGPKRSPSRELMLLYAAILVEDLVKKLTLKAGRQRKKSIEKRRGDRSSSELAHELVARRLRLAGGPALRNELSARRNRA